MQESEQLLTTSKSHEYSHCFKYISITMRYVGEVFVVILLAVTSYASLQKGYAKWFTFKLCHILTTAIFDCQGIENPVPVTTSAFVENQFNCKRLLWRWYCNTIFYSVKFRCVSSHVLCSMGFWFSVCNSWIWTDCQQIWRPGIFCIHSL